MVKLFKLGEEPLEGIVMATCVPKELFTEQSKYSMAVSHSLKSLESLALEFKKKIPNRYRRGFKKEKQTEDLLFVYNNCKEGETKSNQLSLTGRLRRSSSYFVQPGKREVLVPTLDIGFTYPCQQHLILILAKLNDYFMFLAKDNSIEPAIKIVNMKDQITIEGNQALYLVFSESEFSIAVLEGESIRKMTYTVSKH